MSADENPPAEEDHESPVEETLEGEGFSDTEDALKGADVTSGTGQAGVNEQQSGDKVTGGATEPSSETDSPDIGGP